MDMVKETLIAKQVEIRATIKAMQAEKAKIIVARVEEKLKAAFDVLPEVTIKYAYESIRLSHPASCSEILSIDERTSWRDKEAAPTYELSTYSTIVNTEFEFKRLQFNGIVAGLFLNNSDLGPALFAKTGLEVDINNLQVDDYVLSKAIDDAQNQADAIKLDAVLSKLMSGQTVAFAKEPMFQYGKRSYDNVFNVVSLRIEQIEGKRKLVNVFVEKLKSRGNSEIVVEVLYHVHINQLHDFIRENEVA